MPSEQQVSQSAILLSETAMPNRIPIDVEALAALCRCHHVRRLAAFGSILREDFNPERSDADFLVDFEPAPAAERMKNYFALHEALVNLLGRPVDLIENGAIRNPFILEKVKDEQQVLYAASEGDMHFRLAVQKGIEQADKQLFIEEIEMDARVARMLSV
jgi:predicted nucleotidyltransferase